MRSIVSLSGLPRGYRLAEAARYVDPVGLAAAARQLAAIRSGFRLLRHPERLTVPLLAIHGAEDPLLRPSAAAALARAVPGGRAVVFAGMGHEVPRRLWPALADEIARNAARYCLRHAVAN